MLQFLGATAVLLPFPALAAAPAGFAEWRDKFRARARTAEGEEHERLWAAMNEIWPHYDEYQAKTDRPIPVIVLERI